MKREILFRLDTPYRQPFAIEGFRFGSGEKACAIVGGIRGNEVQQMYVCARLVKAFSALEEQGALLPGNEILVIPCVNRFSMNVGSRFWPMDQTDINRMFPGYDQGETTQRIAAALFDTVKEYQYGIQFASFYMPGDFVPHVRMMETGCHTASLANLFGLPFVMLHKPGPYDTATLNYNWQLWDTNAFSIYTKETDRIDDASAAQAVAAVLRFLSRLGVVKYTCHSGCLPSVLHEEDLTSVITPCGGVFRRLLGPGEYAEYGQVLGQLLDPFTGEVRAELRSPTSGTVFFAIHHPLCTEPTVAFRIIRRMRL